MNNLYSHEKEAFEKVSEYIRNSTDEIDQNRAIDRHYKMSMSVAIRNGALSSEMFEKALDVLKPKQK